MIGLSCRAWHKSFMLQTWGEVFSTSLQGLWYGFISFVPSLIVAIIIFIVGWVVGSVIGKLVMQVVQSLKIDKVFESAGADEVMARAGMRLNIGAFLGGLVKWFIVLVFLMTSLEILGLTQVTDFLREVVLSYLPQVIIASLILVAATIIADAMGKVVTAAAKAGNIRSANMLGTIVRYAIWILAFIIALSELGIGREYMLTIFQAVIYMFALAGALAFGLGGRDAAARAIEHIRSESQMNKRM